MLILTAEAKLAGDVQEQTSAQAAELLSLADRHSRLDLLLWIEQNPVVDDNGEVVFLVAG